MFVFDVKERDGRGGVCVCVSVCVFPSHSCTVLPPGCGVCVSLRFVPLGKGLIQLCWHGHTWNFFTRKKHASAFSRLRMRLLCLWVRNTSCRDRFKEFVLFW